MTDELRERLARLDPMHPGVEIEAVTTMSSQELLEEVMSTPAQPPTEDNQASRQKPWIIAFAASAALVVAIGAAIALSRADSGDPVAQTPPLELNAGGGNALASCIQFSVQELARMPLAFQATVAAVDGDSVTLDVDRWFQGGEASQVVLNAPQGLEALIGSIPFVVGQQYLITASDGNVNYCDFSGPSTPELLAAFEEAFGS